MLLDAAIAAGARSAEPGEFTSRAYFNRRLKAERFLARREAEIEAFKAEQERLKFEAERKRVEDALLKESEDREKAAAEQKRLEDEARKSEEERRKAAPAGPDAGAPSDPASSVVHATTPQDAAPKTDADGADPAARGLY